ncbi:MAG TPA: alpha/beta hydrolase [Streptosporangiaceae bacterium]|nr:alpha/beta hydrolase [Streptosporangiaceae bacterium]
MTGSPSAYGAAPQLPSHAADSPGEPGEPGERMVRSNGVELCAQALGDAEGPAILLIMGSTASMDWWEDDFCERLAAGRRFVVRYDHRDTGRSVSYQPGAPPYTLRDLAADAVGLLDTFGLARAHLVGMSMGGAIAQLVALDRPGRVTSLTLIATSPAGPADPGLPGMSPQTRARFAAIAEPAWSDRTAVIDYVVQLARVSAGRSRPFPEAATRELARRALDRTVNVESSMTNHHAMKGDDHWRERLGELTAPALVVHGTDDPVLPYDHGIALAKEIPGAHLLPMEQVGHELPRAVWDVVIPAILWHTSGA